MLRRPRGLVIALLAGALLACAPADEEPAAAPTTTTTTEPSTTTSAGLADGRPYEVERSELVVVDPSRPTAASAARGLAEQPSRTLPTLVLTPVGAGPFPVVVFSHGVTASGPVYEPFLHEIAAAGYVVAAPTYPLSSGPGGEISDYVNQPGDLYAVLDEVVSTGEGRVDGERVAVAGHSLGAMTTIGAAYNSCCADPRIDAAIAVAGVEAPFPGGDFDERPPTPLLLAHGDQDQTIRVDASERLASLATGPVALLRFPAGGHSDIFVGDAGEVLRAAIVAWLDRWLLDDPAGLEALPAAVGSSGVAELELDG